MSRFFAIFRKVLDRAALQVADHRDVLMPTRHRFFINAEVRDHASLLGLLPALDGSLHEAPGLVPTELQHASAAQNIRLQERVNRMPLEGESKPRSWQRPRNCHLANAVLQAIHARNARVQPGETFTMIEVPPLPQRNVIVERQRQATLRTEKLGATPMLQRNIDASFLHGKEDLIHLPRLPQTQQLGKE